MLMRKLNFLLFIVLLSCSTKKEAGYSHLMEEKLVKPKQIDKLPIKYQIFRENKTDCKIYYQLDPKDFLSMRDSSGMWSRAIGVELKIKANQLGSSTFKELKKDMIISVDEIVCDSFYFELPERKDVIVEINVFDKNKHVYQNFSSFWERDAEFIPEDFLIVKGGFVPFGQVLLRKNAEQKNDFKLEVYQGIFLPAEPIFSINQTKKNLVIEPEIEFTGNLNDIVNLVNELKVESYCRLFPIEPSDKKSQRNFHFTIQSNSNNFTVAPLIYLLNRGAGKNATVSMNDWTQFWFRASNNDAVKAERLINEFQRRIKYANDNFGSYKSGWQTDRGMMYILLGEPDRVQNDIRGEIWIYGFAEINNMQFVFQKTGLGINDNDYVLERGLYYREIWQTAILKWENGWINTFGY